MNDMPMLSVKGGLSKGTLRAGATLGVALAALIVLLAGCAVQPPGSVAATLPAPPPSAPPQTAAPDAGGQPTPAAPATPQPAPITSPPQRAEPFFLGVPVGDAYSPSSLAVDAKRRLAYVYCSLSSRGPVISILDLPARQVVRTIALNSTGTLGGRVLLSPDGTQGYAVDSGAETLIVFDPQTGELGAIVKQARDAALSPDGTMLYVIGWQQLSAYEADGMELLWTVSDVRPSEIAVNQDRVAISVGPADAMLLAYDARGQLMASARLPDFSQGLAGGPEGGWAARVATSPPRLLRFDANLVMQADTPAIYGSGLVYDEARRHYLLGGYTPVSSPEARSKTVLQAVADTDLKTLQEQEWTSALPDIFAAYEDTLLALTRFGNAHLDYVDPTTLQSTGRAILGVRLMDMALDETGGLLYVADNQGRVHVLDLPQGQARAVWQGEPPIALDAANKRLYVNWDESVLALDTQAGQSVARFPGGVPAPDPQRDLVYTVNRGVTIYNRGGQQVGRLDSTFPIPNAPVPNPAAVFARVHPASGYLAAWINNGVPGSNNSTYLQFFPPSTNQPIAMVGHFRNVYDMVFDLRSGNTFASFDGMSNVALQLLDASGQEIKYLNGRFGHLAWDAQANLLYVAQDGVLARVRGDAFLQDLYRAPAQVDQVILDGRLRQLYFRGEYEPRVRVIRTDELAPLDSGPQLVDKLPEQDIRSLQATSDSRGLLLYAQVDTTLYRSRDGAQWEKLPVGSVPVYGQLTLAGESLLFYAGEGQYGSDGVWRSLDGGDSWELLADGLTDLRTPQQVAARGADTAYFVGQTGGLFAWRPTQRRWERVLAPENEYTLPGVMSLAPNGGLFLLSYNYMRRSDDGGLTWRDLALPAHGGEILGFVPGYVYAWFGSEEPHLMRSPDDGQAWERAERGLALPAYVYGLKLAAYADTLYLYLGDYGGASLLFRSHDRGASWQAADPGSIRGTTQVAVAPDGRLWFAAGSGTVRALAPTDITWAAPVARPSPALSPTPPLPAGCSQPLPEREARLAQEFPDLGCPITSDALVQLARQSFQYGQMIWRGDEATILVLNDDGGWQSLADTWQEGQPDLDPALEAPGGLQQPVRGFGKAWREQLGGASAQIGWATAAEQPISGSVQAWDGGLALYLESETCVLLNDGSWRLLR